MKILLFGGAGQLGLEIQKRAGDWQSEISAPLEEELDITNLDAVAKFADSVEPDCILNAAAYTAVDRAETDQEKCYKVNADGPAVLAKIASSRGIGLIQISTDYVFEGSGSTPLDENDPVNPLSVYGKSKLKGERLIQELSPDRSLIVRTSSLHGQFGINFVHTMLKLFEEKEEIKVVNDQIMSPTWAGWLAEALLDLSTKRAAGIVHASCSGAISWYDFACAIKTMSPARRKSDVDTRILPVPAAEFPRPAPRPRYSAFNLSKISSLLGCEPIPWLNGLQGHLRDIGLA